MRSGDDHRFGVPRRYLLRLRGHLGPEWSGWFGGLARGHQVLCVTHLPQLAAFGDQRLRVEKETGRGRTTAHVRVVTGGERVAELALMLGGDSESNRRSAAELLAQARA